MERYNVMTVGDRGTGKTCFSIVFYNGTFPKTYVPTVCDRFEKDIKTNEDRRVEITALEDSSRGEDYDRLRPLSYPGTDVFIALFSVASRESFENVKRRWIPEVRKHRPKAPFIIVGNKIDLRDKQDIETVSTEEGLKMAREMGTSYYEVSAMQMRGVEECFKLAVELAELNTKSTRKRFGTSSVIIPPIKPVPEPTPAITLAESTFVSDWTQMMTDPKFHDVTFVVQGGKTVFAHKLVLCSTSPFFTKLFITKNYSREDVISGKVQGIQKVENNNNNMDCQETIVELSSDVSHETFCCILQFLYTGSLSVNSKTADNTGLKRAAQMFEVRRLEAECDAADSNSDGKTGSSTVVDAAKPTAMRDYLRQDVFSDVVFIIGDTRISAHRVVICARCPKLVDLLDSLSTKTEGATIKEVQIPDASVENFTIFLDYLYSDHPDVDATSDLIGLISLANTYGTHRLVTLCEVKLKTTVNTTNAIELLSKFKECKAGQLVDWCLHFMSHNYCKFSDGEDFSTLEAHDRNYVETHRWPPLHYYEEVEEFYKSLQDRKHTTRRKCVII